MAKVEKARITWEKVDPRAVAPVGDPGHGFRLATVSRVDLYQGHRAILRTGLAPRIPLECQPIFATAGTLAYQSLVYDHSFGHRGELCIHVFSIGDYLRIEPGDVVARLVLVPVAAVELVEDGSHDEAGAGSEAVPGGNPRGEVGGI